MKTPSLLRQSIAVTAVALLSACGSTPSTSSLPISNGKVQFPPIEILTSEPFQWDETASEALNITKMAQPAGIGLGLKDYKDGTQASINRQGGLGRVFDATTGLISGGIVNVVQSESLAAGVNSTVEWNPTVVSFVEPEKLLVSGKVDFRRTRDYLAAEMRKAIEKEYPKTQWGDVLTFKKRKTFQNDFEQIVKGEMCSSIRKVDSAGEPKLLLNNYSQFYYEGKNLTEPHCYIEVAFGVTGKTEDGKLVVVGMIKKGTFFTDVLKQHFDGYVMVPDVYKPNYKTFIREDYAYVVKGGEELLFQEVKK